MTHAPKLCNCPRCIAIRVLHMDLPDDVTVTALAILIKRAEAAGVEIDDHETYIDALGAIYDPWRGAYVHVEGSS